MEDVSVDIDPFNTNNGEAYRPYARNVTEIFHDFRTSVDGLTTREAKLRANGSKNTLEEKEKESLLKRYLGQFTEPLILLLLVSALISIIIGAYDDAFSIILAVIIVSTVAFVQEYRSEKSLEALTQLVTYRCEVVRDGVAMELLAEELVEGDVVALNRGVRVPADLRLFETIDLRIDESILTGESKPAKKDFTSIFDDDAGLADRQNMAFMGTMVIQGKGKGVVVSRGDNTELGRIFQLIQNAESAKTPLQVKMDELGKHLSILSFGIIGFIFILGTYQGNSMLEMFNVGVSLAVAAIPEGLPIVVTVTLALGVTRMAKRNAIVRKLPAVEALGGVSVICVDKTGTLTKNKMTVTKFYTSCIVSTSSANLEGHLEFMNDKNCRFEPKHDFQLMQLLKVGLLCNNAQQTYDGSILGNPTEGALLSAALHSGYDDIRKKYTRLEEIPFGSETKWMAVKCTSSEELAPVYYVKGAYEVIISKCTRFYSNDMTKLEIEEAYKRLAAGGLRVVALAYGNELNDLTFVGLAGISDPLRHGVKDAVRKTRESGIRVVMITGDSRETAIAIAQDLGIFERDSLALSYQDIDTIDHDKLDKVVVFYRMSPSHKTQIIQAFRDRGDVVAMTGDGVNDAPSLKLANIGIAMGKGSDVCKESSEIVLVDNNFATIVAAVEEGKGIYANIQNFLRFQLSTSMAALGIIAYCTVFNHPLPLNPMQILWINIIMDGPPAQSLGLEPVSKEIMKQPPRNPKTPVITQRMIVKVASGSIVMALGTLWMFFKSLEMSDPEDKKHLHATTMAFSTFVMFQMFNALNCRSAEQSVFKIGFFLNKYFIAAIGGSILMQLFVLNIPFLQYIFETTYLTGGDLLVVIAVSSSVFIIDEVCKFLKI